MISNKGLYLIMRGVALFVAEFRYNLLSLITLSTLIFVYHLFFTVGIGAANFLSHISEINTVRAYIQPDIKYNLDGLLLNINAVDGVEDAKYYSKSDAKLFIIKNAPNIKNIASFADEFFPEFIEIIPISNDEKTLNNLEKSLKNFKEFETISYGKEYMQRFITISKISTLFITIISMLFGVSIVFVTYNTINVCLFRFKDEIKLYALVGGTRPFLSVPYVVSSMLSVTVAYLVSFIAFESTYVIFSEKVMSPAGLNIFNSQPLSYFIFIYLLILFLAFISSIVSVTSFLKSVPSVNED